MERSKKASKRKGTPVNSQNWDSLKMKLKKFGMFTRIFIYKYDAWYPIFR